MRSFLLLLTVVLISCTGNAQHHHHGDSVERDTFYIVHENVAKNKFWGNSWYTGLSYTLAYRHEFMGSFGRTFGSSFGSGGGFNIFTSSWGVSFAHYQRRDFSSQTLGLFAEVSNFFLPPATARVDYLYDFRNNAHYVRPSVGLSFFAFDLLYNYSFLLHGQKNQLQHGITIRFKFYPNNKNWEQHYPNRC